MPITDVLAGVVVADFDRAVAWYERLLGSPATIPMEGEAVAEWHLGTAGAIQLIGSPERGGRSMLTLVVDDLESHAAALAGRGLELGPMSGTPGVVRIAAITDPEGNTITFAEDLRGSR